MTAENRFRNWRTYVSKYVKIGERMPFGGALWVPRMSTEGFICIRTTLADAETPLIAV